MAYSELVKSFEKIRAYMREFYVYGFKSRNEYNAKSARSYDDERRRIESWLGDYMKFTQTAEGKNIFLSIDSRSTQNNPLYKAWKTKSFTDGDITLHFILFDILYTPEIRKSLPEIIKSIDGYLTTFSDPMTFDESTIRKKLKEYVAEGIIKIEKEGRKVFYSRMPDTDILEMADVIDLFSEVAPCGVVGYFLQDKLNRHNNVFAFKHHYITHAIDSDILAQLFNAIHEKRFITVDNIGMRSDVPINIRLLPLKIYISAQNGRQHLIAFREEENKLASYRLDRMRNIQVQEECPKFDELRKQFKNVEAHMWGVNCKWSLKYLEHVEFDVYVADDELYIVQRLHREKRCGTVQKLDDNHYRYSADVFDTSELIPWIRTFIMRITRLNFSDKIAENKFKQDLEAMYKLYGIDGGDEE